VFLSCKFLGGERVIKGWNRSWHSRMLPDLQFQMRRSPRNRESLVHQRSINVWNYKAHLLKSQFAILRVTNCQIPGLGSLRDYGHVLPPPKVSRYIVFNNRLKFIEAQLRALPSSCRSRNIGAFQHGQIQ
jgi:hypothetical protein